MAGTSANFTEIGHSGGFQNAIATLRSGYEHYYGFGETPRTLLEIKLCEVSGAIRDREKWWIKVNDEGIVRKWRDETGPENRELFEYALKECRWYTSKFTGPVRPAAVDGVYSHEGTDSRLLGRLLAGVQRIQDLERRDVHPDSDGLVIDHVHPSMYAYEQGVTPVIGGADVYKIPNWKDFIIGKKATPEKKADPILEEDEIMCSRDGLVWLPSEFYVRKVGSCEKCEINSYINSLHPIRHRKMYDAIGEAFLLCVPLFEQVLSELGTVQNPRERPRRIGDALKYNHENWDSELEDDDDFDDEAYWEAISEHKAEVPKEFISPPETTPYSLREKHLQVIVKLASIELTPEKPKYTGGSWHVEGMKNERIVATSCMYVESANCTDSMLEFRAAVAEPEDYDQGDERGCRIMYGLEDEKPLVQPRGACRTLSGRVLCWPNTLQHRVRPFELADPTKPGKRTILCFFLVDPTLRIRSTATVPPQCREWLDEAIREMLSSKLPHEVSAEVSKHLYGLSYEDACERRERLMNERKQVGDGEDFYERPFSLCEH